MALAVPLRDGRVLVTRRADEAHQGGRWEFPGGRIEPAEDPAQAARRELAEETGLAAGALEPLVAVEHDYEDRAVRLHVYLAAELDGEPRPDGGRAWRWVSPAELATIEMPAANAPIVRAVRERLG